MKFLRHSTNATIKLGPYLNPVDGTTPEVDLTPHVKLAKNGGAIIDRNASTPVVHDTDGYYTVELDQTDTESVGLLKVISRVSGIMPVWEDFTVVPAKVYDALVTGIDHLDVVLAPSGIDRITIETDVNARQALVAILAACAGQLNGSGSGTVQILGGNVTTPRITATTDNSGNRHSVVLTLPE